MSAPKTFSIALHHLAPDAKSAGVGLADAQLTAVTPEELRALLEDLAALAPSVHYPVTPEMRITSDNDQFVVQVKEGRIRFTSWSVRTGGGELTPRQILTAITGIEEEGGPNLAGGLAGRVAALPRASKIVMLAAAILISNGITAWMLTRPPPDMLPEYRLMEPEPGTRLLADVAGVYETGSAQGDRALTINADGTVRWVTFGDNRTIAETSDLTAQPVLTGGRPALLTDNRALIEISEPVRVVYYGDTYNRK